MNNGYGMGSGAPQQTKEINVEDAVLLIKNAATISVITGAGISAESGISTFRDPKDGLWTRFDPNILSNLNGFAEDPQLVWDWYIDRRVDMMAAQPNLAHLGLAKIAKTYKVDVMTQNIDDLHERAGSSNVIHFHGDIHGAKCFAGCGWVGKFEDTNRDGSMPACPSCSGLARPNVVWFNEALDNDLVWDAKDNIVENNLHIIIGTSGQVEPVASLVYNYARPGTKVLSINKRTIDHMWYADYSMTGSAGWIIDEISKRI